MKTLAVIPVRGGSKSVPDKNLTNIGGGSLIKHVATAVNNSNSVQRVIVSTDSVEIADNARANGLEVPFMRPPELAKDETTDWPVFEHCLNWLRENEGYVPDIVVHIRVTSPFAFKKVKEGRGGVAETWEYLPREKIIDDVVGKLVEEKEYDSVRTVELLKDSPYKMWRVEKGLMTPLIVSGTKEMYNMPRQKIPPAYLQNGYVDVARYGTIMGKKSMNGDCIGAYILDCDYLVDIDQYADIELGELLYQKIIKKND